MNAGTTDERAARELYEELLGEAKKLHTTSGEQFRADRWPALGRLAPRGADGELGVGAGNTLVVRAFLNRAMTQASGPLRIGRIVSPTNGVIDPARVCPQRLVDSSGHRFGWCELEDASSSPCRTERGRDPVVERVVFAEAARLADELPWVQNADSRGTSALAEEFVHALALAPRSRVRPTPAGALPDRSRYRRDDMFRLVVAWYLAERALQRLQTMAAETSVLGFAPPGADHGGLLNELLAAQHDRAGRSPRARLARVIQSSLPVGSPSRRYELSAAGWRGAGALFCHQLAGARDLPPEFLGPLQELWSADAAPPAARWQRLRMRHLRSTWFHGLHRLRVADVLEIGKTRANAHGPDDQRADALWNRRILFANTPPSAVQALLSEPADTLPLPLWGSAIDRGRVRRLPSGHAPSEKVLRAHLDEAVRQVASSPSGREGPPGWAALRTLAHTVNAYRRHPIAKRSGGLRWLDVPSEPLAAVQRSLLEFLALWYPGHGHCAGFLEGRSPAYHARMHAGAKAAAVVDIKDFFGSVRAWRLRPWLRPEGYRPLATPTVHHPFAGWSAEGLQTVEDLVFRRSADRAPYLAQGAPTSPFLANLAAHSLDKRVMSLADEVFGVGTWAFSRYADDLVLSSREDIPGFATRARGVLQRAASVEQWKLNRKKTRIWHAGWTAPLRICGIVVPGEPRAPLALDRERRRRLRAALHHLKHGGVGCHSASARGFVAYAYSVTGDPALLAPLSTLLREFAVQVAGERHATNFLLGWADGA